MKNHKKAFTLTELLVVVIVLGVLAGVCAPKFMRVLETRKTTEAEEVLGAVRTEQEQRCVLGKSYLTAPDKVDALASAGHSKNYTYSLQSTGASASSKKGYTLKMLSYKEGSLCCEGEYCDKLNKSYPKCSDTPVSDECAGEVPTEPDPKPDPEDPCVSNPNSCACGTYASANQCECNPSMETCCSAEQIAHGFYQWSAEQNSCVCNSPCCNANYAAGHPLQCNLACKANPSKATCCAESQQGDEYVFDASIGRCSVQYACDESTKPASSETCNCTGTHTRTVTCDTATGAWKTGAWSACQNGGECSPGANNTTGCPTGNSQPIFLKCSDQCKWEVFDDSRCHVCEAVFSKGGATTNVGASDFASWAAKDTCDGSLEKFDTACTKEMLNKGSCVDYYKIYPINAKPKQEGVYVVGTSEYETLTFQPHMHRDPIFALCSTSKPSGGATNRVNEYMYNNGIGWTDLPKASVLCDKQCNGQSGTPDGTRACNTSFTWYGCTHYPNTTPDACRHGSSLCSGSNVCGVGYGWYVCDKLTVKCTVKEETWAIVGRTVTFKPVQ